MNKLLTIIFLEIFCLSLSAQTPNWAWADSPGGTQSDAGYSIATDANGNVYVAGEFSSQNITFGTTTLTNNSPVNSVGPDIFLVKYDPYGNVLWAKSEGGIYGDQAIDICIDLNGNVYLTGLFNSPSITFGTTTLINVSDTSHSYLYDIFLVKYDASGNVLWAKSHGGEYMDVSSSITTDASGNVYLTGYFGSDSINFDTTTLINSSWIQHYDFFITKYNASGNVIWAKSEGGQRREYSGKILLDANENIYVLGAFTSPYLTIETTTLTNASQLNIPPYPFQPNSDIFIAKYNPMGNLLWATSAGGISDDYGSKMEIDPLGNVYVTGHFESDSISFGTSTLINDGLWVDNFIVKYNTVGQVLWAKSIDGEISIMPTSISIDASSNVYLTGSFYSDSISFGTNILTNAIGNGYSSDIFVVKYDSSDNVVWAKSVGGIDSETSYSIALDTSDNVYITGGFMSQNLSFGTTTLTNAGFESIFIAKLGTNYGMTVETRSENEIQIFPNPFSYSTTIQTDISVKNASITVYNITGQTVKETTNLSGNTFTLNRDNLPSGVYFVRLIENNIVLVSQKIVIVD